jgi:hypothetical protein
MNKQKAASMGKKLKFLAIALNEMYPKKGFPAGPWD